MESRMKFLYYYNILFLIMSLILVYSINTLPRETIRSLLFSLPFAIIRTILVIPIFYFLYQLLKHALIVQKSVGHFFLILFLLPIYSIYYYNRYYSKVRVEE